LGGIEERECNKSKTEGKSRISPRKSLYPLKAVVICVTLRSIQGKKGVSGEKDRQYGKRPHPAGKETKQGGREERQKGRRGWEMPGKHEKAKN